MATQGKAEKFYQTLVENNKITKEEMEENLKRVAYIRKMAGFTSTNIKRWDLHKIFSEDGVHLFEDVRKLNEAFFTKKSEVKESKKDEHPSIASIPGLAESIDSYVNSNHQIRVNAIQRNIENITTNIHNYQRDLNHYFDKLVAERLQLEELNKGTTPSEKLKEQLDEILSEGNWVNPVFVSGFLYLNTAASIELTYENKAAGLNFSASLGQFFVKIGMNNWNLQVLPYKSNISSRGYFHPHVSADGWICWGKSSSTYKKFAENLELANILRLLYGLLSTYCDERPYVPIQNFKSGTKYKYPKSPSAFIHPDRAKERERKRQAKLEALKEETTTTSNQVEYDSTNFTDTVTVIRESDGQIF